MTSIRGETVSGIGCASHGAEIRPMSTTSLSLSILPIPEKQSMRQPKHLTHLAPLLALCTSTHADFVSLSENFSSRQQFNYSTWLGGCFGGAADIRTMDALDTLVVYSGFLDHNANGMISVDTALTNNGSAEQTFILFNQANVWDRFAGDFSCAWNATTAGLISFTFLNTATSSSQTVTRTLEGLNGSLRSLDFRVAGGFNQVIIAGNFVIMDNLTVSVPSPAVSALVLASGLLVRRRRG